MCVCNRQPVCFSMITQIHFLFVQVKGNVNNKIYVFVAGIYEVSEDNSTHDVTPLWVAAVANKLDVVKSLVEHGADVNSPSDTDSTPVRSACYMTNISVIKYLTAHGANLHKPNANGGSCLINAVQSSELCQFLIDQGVDINAVDNSGNLALHYAIREGMSDTVKLLLKHNSDYQKKNMWGDDALQTAALRGNQTLVDIILDTMKLSVEDAIKAYELLGTNFIDEKNDIVSGLKVWKKAMCLRYINPKEPLLKDLPPTKDVFKHCKEPQTLEELEIIHDPDYIYMLTLLIRERILGPCHKDTTFGLMYRGAVYADSLQFQRCVELWKYSYELRYFENEPFNNECQFTVQALVKLFWEIYIESEDDTSIKSIHPDDFLGVFKLLSNQIVAGRKVLKDQNDCKSAEYISSLQELMQLYLHMIHLFSKFYTSKNEKPECMQLIHKVLMHRPHGQQGNSLLHLALDPSISLDLFYPSYQTSEVVEILLRCGADVAAQNHDGNTPLLHALKCMTNLDENIVKLLLEAGSHIDTCNKEGICPLKLMNKQGFSLYPMNYLSLRCLAASVIMKCKVPFKHEIPETLVSFVQLHGNFEV